ncbi:MAG: F0F1 ATP synthase subunit B [Planctomycetota bacterium]
MRGIARHCWFWLVPVMLWIASLGTSPLWAAAADDTPGESTALGLTDVLLSTFLWALITFMIVLFILHRKAWSPLLKALDEREKRIQDSLKAAERAAEESKRLAVEHERVMAEARRDASATVEEGKRDAQVVKEGIISDAREASKRIMERAKAEIERAKDIAVDEVHKRAVGLAIQISEKLIRKNLDSEDNERLVQETIDRYERHY